MAMNFRLLDAGDTAFTIEFGEGQLRRPYAAIAALDEALVQARAAGSLPGIVETVPTLRSLTVIYDPLIVSRAEIETPVLAALRSALATPATISGERRLRSARHWRLPICYGDEIAGYGADLEQFAEDCGLTVAEVIRQHSAATYDVYMLGFLPGFAYLGELPQTLARPRRSEPRLRVPAGSLATAGTLTAIYPWPSPGGWNLIGACPVPLFSAAWPQAALLLPGDRVSLRAIDAGEFRCWQSQAPALRAAPLPPARLLVNAGDDG